MMSATVMARRLLVSFLVRNRAMSSAAASATRKFNSDDWLSSAIPSSSSSAFISRKNVGRRVQERPIRKDFYVESETVTARSQADVNKWLEENSISLAGDNLPRPVLDFVEAGFPPELLTMLERDYSSPTVIQSISWPVASSGRDLVSVARTGSGKTLAYALPALMHIRNNEKAAGQMEPGERSSPVACVLVPTRELAQQVQKAVTPYAKMLRQRTVVVFGGMPKDPQRMQIDHGVDLMIATPGRLQDFLEEGSTDMRRCSYLVLDEADRMLDMGFEPQIRKIIEQIRPDRQTLMFSATWPKEVRTLAANFQKDPAFLNVGSCDLAANHNIKQLVEVIEERDKFARLKDILNEVMDEDPNAKILVFARTKDRCDFLSRWLYKNAGIQSMVTHGGRSQLQRDTALNDFRSGRRRVLVATDVAARGLDVNDVTAVVNVDYPMRTEDYVHRIGRTARGDRTGTAYTMFSPTDGFELARSLIRVMHEAKQEAPSDLVKLVKEGKFLAAKGFKAPSSSSSPPPPRSQRLKYETRPRARPRNFNILD